MVYVDFGSRKKILWKSLGTNCLVTHSSKWHLCSTEERNSFRFKTTWEWINDDRIFIFGRTIPLMLIKHKEKCRSLLLTEKLKYSCFNKNQCIIDVCTVSHRSEYTPHIFVNILLYLFMWQHWRNDTLLQCKVVSVNLLSPQNNSTHRY